MGSICAAVSCEKGAEIIVQNSVIVPDSVKSRRFSIFSFDDSESSQSEYEHLSSLCLPPFSLEFSLSKSLRQPINCENERYALSTNNNTPLPYISTSNPHN